MNGLQIAEIEAAIKKKVIFIKTFKDNGRGEFKAYTEATQYCESKNIKIGSTQRDAPVGLAKQVEYIPKWRDLGEDKDLLDGAIIFDRSSREGDAHVLLAFDPEVQ